MVQLGQPGIGETPADCRIHQLPIAARKAFFRLEHHQGRAAHAFHSAGNENLAHPGLDHPGGEIDRL